MIQGGKPIEIVWYMGDPQESVTVGGSFEGTPNQGHVTLTIPNAWSLIQTLDIAATANGYVLVGQEGWVSKQFPSLWINRGVIETKYHCFETAEEAMAYAEQMVMNPATLIGRGRLWDIDAVGWGQKADISVNGGDITTNPPPSIIRDPTPPPPIEHEKLPRRRRFHIL